MSSGGEEGDGKKRRMEDKSKSSKDQVDRRRWVRLFMAFWLDAFYSPQRLLVPHLQGAEPGVGPEDTFAQEVLLRVFAAASGAAGDGERHAQGGSPRALALPGALCD